MSTIAALCAAVDAGDDAVLPILADALEEAGDGRAAKLRLAPHLYRPLAVWRGEHEWAWVCGSEGLGGCWSGETGRTLFRRLKGGRLIPRGGAYRRAERVYPTRSAAYLALSLALTEMTS